jgi:hypothetical protein
MNRLFKFAAYSLILACCFFLCLGGQRASTLAPSGDRIALSEGKYLQLEYIGNYDSLFKVKDKILHNPRAIEVLDYKVFILNSKLQEILVFDLNFNYLKSIGGQGSGPKEFLLPMDLAVDKEKKRLYITDSRNFRIQCFDAEGNFISSAKSSLVLDSIYFYDGKLLVSTLANMGVTHWLSILSTNGEPIGKLFEIKERMPLMNRAIYRIAGVVDGDFFIYSFQTRENRLFQYNLKTGKSKVLGTLNTGFQLPEITFKERKLEGFLRLITDIDLIRKYNLILCSVGGGGDLELIKKYNWSNAVAVFDRQGKPLATWKPKELEVDNNYGYKTKVCEEKDLLFLLSPENAQIYVYKYQLLKGK